MLNQEMGRAIKGIDENDRANWFCSLGFGGRFH